MEKDNREYNRYSILARANIVVKNEINSVAINTRISDISETGLGVYSAELIGLGEEVSINIEFPDTEGDMKGDYIEGKVVWISMKDDVYYVGIFFDEKLSADKQPNLYRYFHEIIKKMIKSNSSR
jgi:c-di-GMP-binding flagellar brake protein YcgR